MEFLEEYLNLPSDVAAYGWIPFAVAILLSVIFSCVYVRYFWSSTERDKCSAFTCVLGLCVALFAAFLLPVDVFLVSFMKNPDGTFKDWATNGTQHTVEKSLSCAYYSFYGAILIFAFLILPLAYFAYEEKDFERRSFMNVYGTAIMYTLVFLLVIAALLIAGAFIPFKVPPKHNTTEWEEIGFLFKELTENSGENALSFVISILTLYGMLNLVLYTATGIASFPITLMKGFRPLSEEERIIAENQAVNQSRINVLRNKSMLKRLSTGEISALADLEEEENLISKRANLMEAEKRSFCYKIRPVTRFINAMFGLIGIIFAIILWSSLLLTNIDKLTHSLGYNYGYILKIQHLPKPLDYIMVQAQKAFPIDYILFFSIIIFLVICTVASIRYMGICCICVKMYKIRPHRTQPQGLIMLCFILMFTILAFNILMYSVLPTYTTYGSQYYCKGDKIAGNCTLEPCSMEAPPDECIMTRAAAFMLRFDYKAWIFPVAYFWLSWVFLSMFVFSFFYTLIRSRKSAIEEAIDRDDFEDSSDEQIIRA